MPTLRETIPLRKMRVVKEVVEGGAKAMAAVAILVVVASPFIIRVLTSLPDSLKSQWHHVKTHLPYGAALLAGWYIVYEYLCYRRHFHDIREGVVLIRKGALLQKEMSLPVLSITDVVIDRDFLDVFFGLYDLHISVPTEESSRFAHIDGLDRQGSLLLRDRILAAIESERVKMATAYGAQPAPVTGLDPVHAAAGPAGGPSS